MVVEIQSRLERDSKRISNQVTTGAGRTMDIEEEICRVRCSGVFPLISVQRVPSLSLHGT
jgi:hypothetical protein